MNFVIWVVFFADIGASSPGALRRAALEIASSRVRRTSCPAKINAFNQALLEVKKARAGHRLAYTTSLHHADVCCCRHVSKGWQMVYNGRHGGVPLWWDTGMPALLRRLLAVALLPGTRGLSSEEEPLPVRSEFVGRRSPTDYRHQYIQNRIAQE